MLGLYLYTLIFGHKSYSMLSILNKLTLQRELRNVVTNIVFWTKSNKNKTIKSNPSRSWELNPGPLTPKAGALPLHHRVN